MNEINVKTAFSSHAHEFDQYESTNNIVKWIRAEFRKTISKYVKPNFKLLDIGAGTGIDAIYYASLGYEVHVIENSPNMVKIINEKKRKLNLTNLFVYEISFMDIDKLNQRFDLIYSNFGVLNCTNSIAEFGAKLSTVCKPQTKFIANVMPHISPWELFNIFKNPRFALQRLLPVTSFGSNAKIGKTWFNVYYYTPTTFVRKLGLNFKKVDSYSVCTIIPPPFLSNRVSKMYFSQMIKIEKKIRRYRIFDSIGDSCIIVANFQLINNS